jgi:hypothetical protein
MDEEGTARSFRGNQLGVVPNGCSLASRHGRYDPTGLSIRQTLYIAVWFQME